MAQTPEDIDTNDAEYAAAFNEDQPGPVEPSEDEAFGLELPKDEGASEGDKPVDAAVVVVADAGTDGGDPTGGTGEMSPGDEKDGNVASAEVDPEGNPGAGGDDDEPTDPKEIQRKKSWEGRLKAQERELAAARAELEAKAAEMGKPAPEVAADALEQVADKAEDQGQTDLAARADEVADQLQEGAISVDDAVKILAEDFGEPFVKMIEAVASSAASKAVEAFGSRLSSLEEGTEAVISHIRDGAQKAHFEAIYNAHPDFAELAKDPAFIAWRDEDPARVATASGGSASEINAMLSEFKGQNGGGEADTTEMAGAAEEPAAAGGAEETAMAQEGDEVDEAEVDAAAGVRSAGMQLPEQPAASDNYADSWEEFEKEDRRKA